MMREAERRERTLGKGSKRLPMTFVSLYSGIGGNGQVEE